MLIFAAAGALLCALCGIVATIILGKFWPAAIGGLAGLGIFGAAMRPPSKFKFREDRWRLPRSRGGA